MKDFVRPERTDNSVDQEVYTNIRNFVLQTILSMKNKNRLPLRDDVICKSPEVFLNTSCFRIEVRRGLAERFRNVISRFPSQLNFETSIWIVNQYAILTQVLV